MGRISQPMVDADAASLDYQTRHAGKVDRRSMAVLTTVAVALTVQRFVFSSSNVAELPGFLNSLGLSGAGEQLSHVISQPANYELVRLMFWVSGCLVAYVLIPVLMLWSLRCCTRENEDRFRIRDCGLRVRGCLKSAPIYLGMLAVMLPAVWYFSRTEIFQSKYPFYNLGADEALWPRFLVWELLYAIQFICLEFFFRGFLLHGTKHRFGASAIWVMMVPYCMIHFAKPMPECFGAIGAGIILGYMSLKTRSIWWGAAVHVAVAWTMDGLAVWHSVA